MLIRLEGAAPLETRIAINAEGIGGGGGQGPTAIALLADLEVEGVGAGTAVERFTREGPLALLPAPVTATQPAIDRKSMIWCLDRDLARQRLELSDAEFASKIQATLGSRIGRVVWVGTRSSFPLLQQHRPRLREHRMVCIGNAAQSLHPVAGQGFNLGMRDSVCLADCVARSPADPIEALSRYEASRKLDRFAISSFTGTLPGLFSSGLIPVELARSIALVAFDLAAPLRRTLSAALMFGIRR